ncbi:hypothetical protein HJG54_00930 [Leptolyngbya sp. NK1-12]|uniref:Uncharacterized protein n=1 Tax=Leptolyngbya sp. NK1-12 TaxID=2547451 RepID=A0AA97AI26_9CYAN|nr:hypothetical protein HJG54_00930 [Leptolyngbya sp. NK1-12]
MNAVMLAALKLATTMSLQIAVYDTAIEDFYVEWNDQHYAQGFLWLPGHVEFNTLGQTGLVMVEVWQADQIQISPNVVRAILVPFTVSDSGEIRVAGDDLGDPIPLAQGEYALIFEIRFQNQAELERDPGYEQGDEEYDLLPEWCRFTFVPQVQTVQAEILRADSELAGSSLVLG